MGRPRLPGRIEELLEAGHSVERVMEATGASKATVYRRRVALRRRQTEEHLEGLAAVFGQAAPDAKPLTLAGIVGHPLECLTCGTPTDDGYWCADCLRAVPLIEELAELERLFPTPELPGLGVADLVKPWK